MKLREAAIRLTLDDWATASGVLAHVMRHTYMTYWYGRSIYVVMQRDPQLGVWFAARNTGMGMLAFWPDPCRLSVAHLCKLDADIADARHEEIISILLAFQKEVQ